FERLQIMPGAGGARPGGELVLYVFIPPETGNHLGVKAHAAGNESELAVSMSRLIQVHEVHVNGGPRQLAVKLRMEMRERLAQESQTRNPHLRGREGVHPRHEIGRAS